MPITHVVQRGDCMSSIAKQFGFRSFRTIYDDPANAALRQKRPDPNLLMAGDRVVIPDKQPHVEERSTGQKHVFFTTSATTRLRIALAGLKPRVYRLTVDGAAQQRPFPASGIIEQPIPPEAKGGKLTVWLTDDTTEEGVSWDFQLGMLGPSEELYGAQTRLNNLGFSAGHEDGVLHPSTQAAVSLFQQSRGETPTSEPDGKVRDELRKAHDEHA